MSTNLPGYAALRPDRANAPRDRLTALDRCIWRCGGCGDWRWGSRDCGVCAVLLGEVAA
jgi:hypothetical protein